MWACTFVTTKPGVPSHPSTAPVHEEQLIEAARRGDQQAFARLMGTYKHMVFTVCSRVLRNREEAEEATQDSFVKAYRNLGGYSGGSRFSTWLYSIAYRTALSALRARRGGSVNLDEVPEQVVAAPMTGAGKDQDLRLVVEGMLARLPAGDAALLTLFYLQDRTVEEIVTITGLSVSNVKVKLHRARQRMLEQMQGHWKQEAWTLIND
ncbi:MAG: sigma-70 family RNA polymerase sigma factor [Flavobacteriales bacterium]|nr:sigma-70 family RNA polymerase sigma factor [Flavobacteriales bacterium]NUQ15939.1 sigma-70 family RNA polymerase sigma factor [Flavobacteriales bacterium]